MDTYRATNTTNGKFYIGSAINFEDRKKAHLRSKKNYPFQNALRKNPDAFEWEVWSDDSDEPILEQALLDMWFGKECCYNLNPIADRPPRLFGSKNPMKRKEIVDRVMKHHRGKQVSQETRQRQSEARKKYSQPKEVREKQGNSRRGARNVNARPIILTNLETGQEEQFDFMQAACDKYGLNSGHLSAVAHGKRKHHKGFTARYVDKG
jgi:group I intron endonuclease